MTLLSCGNAAGEERTAYGLRLASGIPSGPKPFGLSLNDVADDVFLMIRRKVDILCGDEVAGRPGQRRGANHLGGCVDGREGRKNQFQRQQIRWLERAR